MGILDTRKKNLTTSIDYFFSLSPNSPTLLSNSRIRSSFLLSAARVISLPLIIPFVRISCLSRSATSSFRALSGSVTACASRTVRASSARPEWVSVVVGTPSVSGSWEGEGRMAVMVFLYLAGVGVVEISREDGGGEAGLYLLGCEVEIVSEELKLFAAAGALFRIKSIFPLSSIPVSSSLSLNSRFPGDVITPVLAVLRGVGVSINEGVLPVLFVVKLRCCCLYFHFPRGSLCGCCGFGGVRRDRSLRYFSTSSCSSSSSSSPDAACKASKLGSSTTDVFCHRDGPWDMKPDCGPLKMELLPSVRGVRRPRWTFLDGVTTAVLVLVPTEIPDCPP